MFYQANRFSLAIKATTSSLFSKGGNGANRKPIAPALACSLIGGCFSAALALASPLSAAQDQPTQTPAAQARAVQAIDANNDKQATAELPAKQLSNNDEAPAPAPKANQANTPTVASEVKAAPEPAAIKSNTEAKSKATPTATPKVSAKPKAKPTSAPAPSATEKPLPKASNIDLEEVITELKPSEETPTPTTSPEPAAQPQAQTPATSEPTSGEGQEGTTETNTSANATSPSNAPTEAQVEAEAPPKEVDNTKFLLDTEIPPNTKTRLVWTPEERLSGLAEKTPVLVVNGAHKGQTLCLTAALHGDELNGIEMIRRVLYNTDPAELTGTLVGVPVVNLMGFHRNSRYLPDRRDLNRYFPGNTSGSSASRIAHSLFNEIILKCDALVDLHTGSFHRTNLTQLRADLSNESVAELAHQFGAIAVLNTRGNYGSLRAAAVRHGVPTVTIEAGEPMRLQNDVVAEGVKAIRTLLENLGMYGSKSRWFKSAPVYYKSYWIRADQSGILFSEVSLGERIAPGEVLGTVTDPITNARSEIISPYYGRVLGMALDQVVMPGFAAYHIGIQTPEDRLKEDAPTADEGGVHADDDGDDAVTAPLPDKTVEEDVLKDRDDLED